MAPPRSRPAAHASVLLALRLGARGSRYDGTCKYAPVTCISWVCPLHVKIYNEYMYECIADDQVRCYQTLQVPTPSANFARLGLGLVGLWTLSPQSCRTERIMT